MSATISISISWEPIESSVLFKRDLFFSNLIFATSPASIPSLFCGIIKIPSALTMLICDAAPRFSGDAIYLPSTLPTFTRTYSLNFSDEINLLETTASISSPVSLLWKINGLTNKLNARKALKG